MIPARVCEKKNYFIHKRKKLTSNKLYEKNYLMTLKRLE